MKYLIKDYFEERWVFTVEGNSGWTTDINKAGRYSREEAERLVEGYSWLLGNIIESPGEPVPEPPKPPTFDEAVGEYLRRDREQAGRAYRDRAQQEAQVHRQFQLTASEAYRRQEEERTPVRWGNMEAEFRRIWPDCSFRAANRLDLLTTQLRLEVRGYYVSYMVHDYSDVPDQEIIATMARQMVAGLAEGRR